MCLYLVLKRFQENHQSLASDVHVVEESLAMVDDCLSLLDKSKCVFSCVLLLSLKNAFGESEQEMYVC